MALILLFLSYLKYLNQLQGLCKIILGFVILCVLSRLGNTSVLIVSS
jgi:hypothetical protein